MDVKEIGTANSEIIFDTPNEEASQVNVESKAITQEESDEDVDNILADLDQSDVIDEVDRDVLDEGDDVEEMDDSDGNLLKTYQSSRATQFQEY